jgi:hypothetical protein
MHRKQRVGLPPEAGAATDETQVCQLCAAPGDIAVVGLITP